MLHVSSHAAACCQVGFEPKLQAAFIQAGGVRMLLDIVELGWPEGSNFAASEFEFGEQGRPGVRAGAGAVQWGQQQQQHQEQQPLPQGT